MLIATQAKSIEGTDRYFDTVLSQGDYYLAGDEIRASFHGKTAERLGLQAGQELTRDQFKRLLAGYHPLTGKKLAQRIRADRRPGVDLTFSPPKSISVLWAINQDERLLEALRTTVHECMTKDVEPLMHRRVRQGEKAASNDRKRTGNLIYSDFLHKTSRPVNSQVDPHLHFHIFTFNVTADGDQFFAADMEEIVRERASLQAKFEARLARRLQQELGYQVEKTRYLQGGKLKSGWEIHGIARSTIEKFSTRTAQVEAYAEEHGIADAAKKGALGVRTREKKVKGQSVDELRQEWRSRLDPQERAAFARLEAGAIGRNSEESIRERAAESLHYALDHHLYRQSTVEKQQVIGTALEHGLALLPEEVEAALNNEEVIRRTQDVQGAQREMITTRSVLQAEERMIAFAREGRGTRMPIGRREHVFKRDWLNDQQKEAVRHVLNSRDTVAAVTGGAGTGKTSLMQEASEAIESCGKKLFVFAPSTGAREVLEEKGFREAQTTEHLLRNQQLQEKLQGQVVWVDEAGQVDVRTMNGIFDIAKQRACRVVLSGDIRQHASPRRGEAMRILEREAGLRIARVEKIQRQQGRYKQAVELISRGLELVDKKRGLSGLVAGFDLLDRMGCIREIPSDQRHAALAEHYVEASGRNAPLVISPTHAEGRAVTDHIRKLLRERGAIGTREREFQQLSSLNLTEAEKSVAATYSQPGMILQFHQNVKGGYQRGERYRVSLSKQGQAQLVPFDGGPVKPIPYGNADRFEVYSEKSIGFAVGDKVRFTLGGTAIDKKRRISNGRLDEIAGFDKQGNLRLKSGMTVARDYGHIDLGYVTTSHASQGKDRDVAIAAMGSQSLAAINCRQLYVTTSRGKKSVTLFVDDKAAVRRAIQKAGEQVSATELMKTSQPVEPAPSAARQHRYARDLMQRARAWWQRRFPQREWPAARPQRPSLAFARPEFGRG